MIENKISILGIPGNLREKSSHKSILLQIAAMAPAGVELIIYNGLSSLPHFNPDIDTENAPVSVADLRNQLKHADAVIICTPEYAFGVPGSLKNAMDWTVSSGELVNKPLALITASSTGEKAHAALQNIFTALSVNITTERNLLIPFIRAKVDEKGNLKNTDDIHAVEILLHSLIKDVSVPE